MFSRAKLNFVVDAIILLAFLAAAVSGIVLLTQPHGGFQGGRNPNFGQTVLLLSRDGWNDVHIWGGSGDDCRDRGPPGSPLEVDCLYGEEAHCYWIPRCRTG